MPEPSSSTAAGGVVLWKFFGGIAAAGVLASALGFCVMWPKTMREALIRAVATMAGSALLGPVVCIAAYLRWPELFSAATRFAATYLGAEHAWAGMFMVAAPLLAMSGLPFWWLLGAVVLWFERRRGKDIVELAVDAKADVKAVLP